MLDQQVEHIQYVLAVQLVQIDQPCIGQASVAIDHLPCAVCRKHSDGFVFFIHNQRCIFKSRLMVFEVVNRV
ncbi:hypothetical protein D3C80_1950260 [compost metagenome]